MSSINSRLRQLATFNQKRANFRSRLKVRATLANSLVAGGVSGLSQYLLARRRGLGHGEALRLARRTGLQGGATAGTLISAGRLAKVVRIE